MTLYIYGARNSQNGMISGPRNGQKMKVSDPRKHHYGPGFFLAPEIVKLRLFLAPEIVNLTKRTFMARFKVKVLNITGEVNCHKLGVLCILNMRAPMEVLAYPYRTYSVSAE